jgi:hypothetical protein
VDSPSDVLLDTDISAAPISTITAYQKMPFQVQSTLDISSISERNPIF